MAITASDVRDRFLDVFDSLSDDLISSVITEATAWINESVWGSTYDTGLLYLTAHLLYSTIIAPGTGSADGGSVVKRKIGDVEVTFGATGSISDSLGLSKTTYGQQYMRLARAFQGGPITATG